MEKRILSFISVSLLLFLSCTEKGPTEPAEEYSGNVKSLDGKVVLEFNPTNSNSLISNLDVLSFQEEDDIKPDNTFDIDVIDSNTPQMVFAVSNNDAIVLGTTILPGQNSVLISEKSTANTFILLNPLFMFADQYQTEEILTSAASCASYNLLVQTVSNVIYKDPENVFNSEKYPQIIELAAQVGYEILAQFEGLTKSSNQFASLGATAPSVEIDQNKTGRVIFKNPNFVALSAEVLHLDTYEKEKIFSLAPRPKLIAWKLGFPPVYRTPPTSRSIDFSADNSFTIEATKGFNFSLPSNEWISPSTPNGRATILNILVIARQVLRYFIGGMVVDAVELAVDKVKVNASESKVVLSSIKIALKNNEVKKATKLLYDFIILNKYAFAEVLVGTVAFFKRKSIASMLKAISDFCPLLKPIGIGYQAGNETIPIFTDLFMGQRTFNYQVATDYSGDIYAAYLIDKDNPIAPHVSLNTWIDGTFRKHYYIKVTCYSEDFIHKRFKYQITNKEYGNSVKLWQTGFTTPTKTYNFETEYMEIGKKAEFEFTVNKGTHELNVFAIDEEGNISPASATHKKRTLWW